MGGSTLIVPDQPVYSVKRFPPTFKYKKSNSNRGSDGNDTKKT